MRLGSKKWGTALIVPVTAKEMARTGDFNVDHHKTWFGNADDYPTKAALMRKHLNEVERGDAALKHGVQNYTGGNVLMEMAVAFHLNKPVFILNELPQQSAFIEEICGMLPIVLHGTLGDLPKSI